MGNIQLYKTLYTRQLLWNLKHVRYTHNITRNITQYLHTILHTFCIQFTYTLHSTELEETIQYDRIE